MLSDYREDRRHRRNMKKLDDLGTEIEDIAKKVALIKARREAMERKLEQI